MSTTARARSAERPELSSASARYEVSSVMREDKYDRTRILLDWVGRKKRVLEIGCSTGYISRRLVRHECEVTGVEIDPVAAEQARAYCCEVHVLDLNSAESFGKLRSGAFDVVLLADVLEHLADPWRALREMGRLLDEGGSVVVSLPNLVHFLTRAKITMGQFNYTPTGILDHTHLRFFTIKTARELILSAGYRITRFHPSIGGRMSGHARPAWQRLADFAPGLFAYQMLFEAKEEGPNGK